MANVTIANTYIMTFPVGTSVTINAATFGSVGSNSYCVEFFVKYDTLTSNSTIIGIGSFAAAQLNIQANTSTFQIASSGNAVRGTVNALANGGISNTVAFLANTWYHIAYMGTGSNTYIGINGRVYNLETIGGSGGVATGQWGVGSFPIIGNSNATSNSTNVYISNFRLTSNGNVYNVQGFVPPNTQLTVLANTSLLLANSTFRNEANNTTLTTTGSPTISQGNVVYQFPLMSEVSLAAANAIPTRYANSTSDSYTINYISRSIGSGANQISKVAETLTSLSVTAYGNNNQGNVAYISRSLGSGANQISKATKVIQRVVYDKDGKIINQFTWG